MNNSLGTFMMIAAIVVIMVALLFGIAFESLEKKNEIHQKNLQTEHQLKVS
ncbi:hypothetical protein [Neobacillus sp.]|jgi:hypothetical protein|uniref:hypothetical protein n=1 Tax=Neobacillus sp. TaxID=2675273 RepID=UPI0035B501AA